MEILRHSRNPWGQQVLEGASWDLIWLFAGAALLFIALHLLYKRALKNNKKA